MEERTSHEHNLGENKHTCKWYTILSGVNSTTASYWYNSPSLPDAIKW